MRGALPLLWLACVASAFATVEPTTLVVAAVFPMFYPDGIKSLPGTRALAAFLLAIEEINNKTDGIHDELLPDSVIEVAYADSKCEVRATLTGLIQLLSLQGGEWGGMSGIIGSWCSSSTIALANMATVLSIPQISFGAMSDDLSDRVRYPFFMRTAPSLVDECYAIVDVLRYLFAYSRVAVMYSNEEYGVSSNTAFRVAAQRVLNGVQLQILQNIRIRMPVGQTLPTYEEEYETLLKSGARVLVLLGQAAAARPFIHGGLAFGIGGDGFVWLGNAGVTDDAIYTAGVMRSISAKHRLRLMKGFFGLHPSLAAQTPAANRLLSHLRANRREGNGTLCDLATDRYGTRLFAADVDGDGTLECAGWQENETTPTGDYWAASAYDAAYALAFGLDDLRRQAVDGGEAFASLASRGAEVFEAVVNSDVFVGASGEVSFYNDSVSTWYGPGDRTSEGQLFALMNFADNEHGLVQVGTVKSCKTCTWESRFSYGPAKLTFSTSDNTKPLDVPVPKPTYNDERGSGELPAPPPPPL
ncbi:hypothetical protein AB1Y20_006116 [Prymnesium parvum]|uniref:Receptor ligand binding region domain-containing protein n=1 Tax=Prymnesium parvum TaxID=97485 RepID=A0AB34J486_PRYPA